MDLRTCDIFGSRQNGGFFMKYDFLVIGAGISGASVAYFLSELGKVCVVDSHGICEGASKAAGAFVSPMMGRGQTADFINRCFRFSTNLYSSSFANVTFKTGLLRTLKTHENALYPPQNLSWQKRDDGYFFDDAMMADPKRLCQDLLQGIDFYRLELSRLDRKNGQYVFGEHDAKYVILAQGASVPLFGKDYIKFRLLWGERLFAKTKAKLDHAISAQVSIAPINGGIAIGSTHVRDQMSLDEKRALSLLPKAQQIMPFVAEDVQILSGTRPASIDYFPIVGEVFDEQQIAQDYPSLKHGTKIPPKLFAKHENVFIHTAHGGRAFVSAPYSAMLLAKLIKSKITQQNVTDLLSQDELTDLQSINTLRLIYRFFRKPQTLF